MTFALYFILQSEAKTNFVNMKKVTIEKILEIINASVKGAPVTKDHLEKDLTENGMDSIAFIQIVVSLEDAFELEIPDSKLLITEMNTVEKIYALLTSLMPEGGENGEANNPTNSEGDSTI